MSVASQVFESPREAAAAYARWISRAGFSDSTKESYIQKVDAYAAWLEDGGDQYDGALSDTDVRNWAVRDYRRQMLTVRKLAPATVATQMAALGSFYEWLGIGRPEGVEVHVPSKRRLGVTDEDKLRAIFRAAKRRGPRDYALIVLMALAGPRLGETAALDVDDVFVNGRVGIVEIRYGKGGKPRTLRLSPMTRDALAGWLKARQDRPNVAGERALFVNRNGGRLAHRTIEHIVSEVGQAAGVHLTPHLLRHTYGRRFMESGGDVVALQETMGHKNLSTTARYAKPSDEYLDEQLARLDIDN